MSDISQEIIPTSLIVRLENRWSIPFLPISVLPIPLTFRADSSRYIALIFIRNEVIDCPGEIVRTISFNGGRRNERTRPNGEKGGGAPLGRRIFRFTVRCDFHLTRDCRTFHFFVCISCSFTVRRPLITRRIIEGSNLNGKYEIPRSKWCLDEITVKVCAKQQNEAVK